MRKAHSSIVIVICAMVLAFMASGSVYAANLLVNGGFEAGPYGVQFEAHPVTPVPGVWYAEGANVDNLFEGIYDVNWHYPAPAEHPEWPTTFNAFEGSYYLGKYYINQPWGAPGSGRMGAAYQIVPVSENTTYYASLWHVGFHPQGAGAGVRVGIDPTGGTDWGNPSIVWYPENSSTTGNWNFDYSDTWKKITASATTPAGATQATMWIVYTMTSNNVSTPQVVQVDGATFSAQQASLYIQDLDVAGVKYTATTADYTVQWKVTDGANNVNAACTFFLNGVQKPAADVSRNATTGIYSITLSGLVLNSTNSFRIEASAANFDTTSYDGTIKAYPVLLQSNAVVSNINATGAKISWDTTDYIATTTPVATTGVVEYGTGYSFSATDTPAPNPTLKSHHEVILTGLIPNTTYKFRTVCERPEGSTNPGPYGKSIKSKAGLFTEYSFTTTGATFWNGDFEQAYSLPIHTGDAIPGWNKFASYTYPGDPAWFANGEWAVPAQHGGRYVMFASNYGSTPKGGMYQRFATTAGQQLVVSGWIWSEAWDDKVPRGGPHRFGETCAKIGIDPMGGIDPGADSVVWTADRETLDWDIYSQGALGNRNWQKVNVAAYAQSTQATIFLKLDGTWTDPWILCGFDNINIETGLTPVTSVAAAKALDNDSAISLSGNVVVTRTVGYSDGLLYAGENKAEPYFYIQDEEGTAGIKVTLAPGTVWPEGLAVGQKVAIEGMITHGIFFNTVMNRNEDQLERLNKPTGERVIKAIKITPGAMGTVPEAVGMSNKALCGGSSSDHWFTNPGAPDGVGPNNVGRIVKVWGKVVDAGLKGDSRYPGHYYMVIDDGSSAERYGSTPANPMTGIYIDCGPMGNSRDFSGYIGKYAAVTGISAIIPDFDWDDPSATEAGTEALKNVRTVKPLTFEAPNIIFMDVP